MIIVEDGTHVVGANSYVSVEELEQYARLRGIDLPEEDEEKEVLLIRAMDYIESYATRFQGELHRFDQTLAWPRWNGTQINPPVTLKKAQMILAVASMKIELMPAHGSSTSFATRKTVGPITIEQTESHRSSRAVVPEAEVLLQGLMKYSGQLRVVRA